MAPTVTQAQARAAYDKALSVPAIQAAFGYGPGTAAANAQADRFAAALNKKPGDLTYLKAIHAQKGAAGLWDQFVDAVASACPDAETVRNLLNGFKASVL